MENQNSNDMAARESRLPTPICSAEDAARKRGRLKAVRDELWTATECLSRAASYLQELGGFAATLTEIKTTIGDLSVSKKMIEEFLSQNVEAWREDKPEK